MNQDKLDKIWEVATTVGKVEGWSADDQGDAQLLVGRDSQCYYQRLSSGGEWQHVPGIRVR